MSFFLHFLSFLVWPVLFLLFGGLFYSLGFHKLGFSLQALGFSPWSCRRSRLYLFNRCPFGRHCSTCKYWTCQGYFDKKDDISNK